MSKPNKKVYRLGQLRQDAAEKSGSTIDFEIDGTEFSIAAPGFFPDAAHKAMQDKSALGLAKALLGDRYDDYAAAGGSADDLGHLLAAWAEDQGTDLPKS